LNWGKEKKENITSARTREPTKKPSNYTEGNLARGQQRPKATIGIRTSLREEKRRGKGTGSGQKPGGRKDDHKSKRKRTFFN